MHVGDWGLVSNLFARFISMLKLSNIIIYFVSMIYKQFLFCPNIFILFKIRIIFSRRIRPIDNYTISINTHKHHYSLFDIFTIKFSFKLALYK